MRSTDLGSDGMRATGSWRSVTAVVVLLLVAACGAQGDTTTTTGGGAELQTVSLVSPVGNHIIYAPIYIADSLGFFAEEGLAMEVLPTDGSSQSVQLVLAGQGDMSPAGVEAVLVGAGAGQDIISYYEWFSAPIYGIVVAEESPINGFEELEGLTLGITGYEAGEVPVASALLQDVGLQFGVDVTVVPVGDELPAIIQALDSGTIDAFAGSVTDFTGLRAGGYSFRQLASPALEQFPGGIVFAAQASTLEAEQDLLVGAARAIVKGTHALLTVPEVGQPATQDALPEAWEDEETGTFWLETISEILNRPDEAGAGSQDPAGWQLYADYLGATVEGQEPILQNPVNAELVVTNDLVEAINDFDRAAVEESARQFVAAN